MTAAVSGTPDVKAKALEVVESAKLGHRWEASVGTGPIALQNRIIVKAGETAEVNGRHFFGPCVIVKNIRLVEISIVPVGADRNTAANIQASGTSNDQKGKSMSFKAWLIAKSIDPATVTAANIEELKAQYLTENPTADAAALDAEIASILNVQAEGTDDPAKTPPASVQEDGAKDPAKTPPASVQADGTKDPAQTPPASAPADGTGEDPNKAAIHAAGVKARRSADDYLASLGYRPGITIHASGIRRNHGAPNPQEVAVAAMLLTKGYDGKSIEASGISADSIDAAASKPFQRFGFHKLFRAAIRAGGYSCGDMDTSELVETGMNILHHNTSQSLRGIHAAGTSTDYTNFIFKDTLDKQVMLKYEDAETPLLDIAKERPTKNFQEVTDFRFAMNGQYKVVGPGSEAPVAKFTDEGWTAKIQKYMLSAKITFEQMCNDDTSALDDIAEMLVTEATETQEQELAKALLAGRSEFTICPGAPLGIEGLAAAVKAWRGIKGPNGKRISRKPTNLLVPSALEFMADTIYSSTEVNESTNKAKGKSNIYHQKYLPIISSLLDADAGLDGASDTDWFLLGDQRRCPILAAAFMEGYKTPQVRTFDLSKTYDVDIVAMFTFAAKIYDIRGAVYCTAS